MEIKPVKLGKRIDPFIFAYCKRAYSLKGFFLPLWFLFILLHSPQLTIMSLYININKLVKLLTLFEIDLKAPFSIATTLSGRHVVELKYVPLDRIKARMDRRKCQQCLFSH